MRIRKLTECGGAMRFGTCSECGTNESDTHNLYRLQFSTSSICLCEECLKVVRKAVSQAITEEDGNDTEMRNVSEDTISRKWVLNEIITKVEDDVSLTDEQKGSLSVAKYLIRHAPPVEPERPRGEWIFKPKDAIDLMFAKPKCNKCGFESVDGGNFCPNCGTDMRGGTGKGRVDGTDAD